MKTRAGPEWARVVVAAEGFISITANINEPGASLANKGQLASMLIVSNVLLQGIVPV